MKINLWKLRTDKKISLRKLAKMTRISKTRLNYIENERSRSPDLKEIEKIAIALNVRMFELFESEYK